jgi:hypothetical protein
MSAKISAQKPRNSECHTLLSERFRIYLITQSQKRDNKLGCVGNLLHAWESPEVPPGLTDWLSWFKFLWIPESMHTTSGIKH